MSSHRVERIPERYARLLGGRTLRGDHARNRGHRLELPVSLHAAVAYAHHQHAAAGKALFHVVDYPDEILRIGAVAHHLGRHHVQPVLQYDQIVAEQLADPRIDSGIGPEQRQPAVAPDREIVDRHAVRTLQLDSIPDESLGIAQRDGDRADRAVDHDLLRQRTRVGPEIALERIVDHDA